MSHIRGWSDPCPVLCMESSSFIDIVQSIGLDILRPGYTPKGLISLLYYCLFAERKKNWPLFKFFSIPPCEKKILEASLKKRKVLKRFPKKNKKKKQKTKKKKERKRKKKQKEKEKKT